LDGGASGTIEETPGLNGNAIRAGINVAVLGVDAARGDEDVAAPVNVAFGGDGGISAGDGTKLGLVDTADEILHFALLAVEFVVEGVLLGVTGIPTGFVFLKLPLGLCANLPELVVLAVDGLLNGFKFRSGDGLELNRAVQVVGAFGVTEIDDGTLAPGARVIVRGIEIVVVPGEGRVRKGKEEIGDNR